MQVLLRFCFFILVGTILLGKEAPAAVVDVATPNPNLNISAEIELSQTAPTQSDFAKLHFKKDPHGRLAQGYSNLDLWMKVSFTNSSETPIHKLLYFDTPLIGRLTAFEESGDFITHEISGPGWPLEMRSVPVRWGAFNVLLEPGQNKTFYIHRSSHHALNTQAFLAEPSVYQNNESQAKTIFFFYLGGIICLVIYNLVLGLSTRQKDYLFYSLFAGSFAVTALALHNVLDTYLLPNSYIVFSHFLMLFSSLTVVAATYFVENFLNIGRNFPLGYWGCRIVRVCALVTLVGSFFAPTFRDLYFLGFWIDILISAALVFSVICGLYIRFKFRYILANYFLISWCAVMVGVMVWICALHGLIRTTPLTQYSLLVANLGEMLILALGLAYKLKTLDEEKRIALQAAAEKERYHRLVKVLSHDVANTVSGVVFHTECLDSIAVDTVAREHVGRIHRLTRKLTEILSTVRAEEVYSSMKSDSLLEKVELRGACIAAIERFSWELEEKNISMNLEVPGGLCIKANRSALVNQVLVNLLSNCIKFSEPGSQGGFRVEEKEREIVLVVWDEGIGIPAEKLPGLFTNSEVYSSAGTQQERGTGFGTKLIGEYMKLFGGTVLIESVFRQSENGVSGTTIRLVFPRHVFKNN